jgi:hypothetical protein
MTVIAIHLVSGQTVLGRPLVFENEQSNNVRVLKPMSLVVQPGASQGQLSVSMMPYLTNGVFPVLEEFEFEQHHILFVRDVPTQLEKLYNETVSGLIL